MTGSNLQKRTLVGAGVGDVSLDEGQRVDHPTPHITEKRQTVFGTIKEWWACSSGWSLCK